MCVQLAAAIAAILAGLAGLLFNLGAVAAEPESRFIEVNGAQLEYLDWGGTGPPIVFLAGLSDTPYIYNDFVSAFTGRFHA